jgi:hypothetical protein
MVPANVTASVIALAALALVPSHLAPAATTGPRLDRAPPDVAERPVVLQRHGVGVFTDHIKSWRRSLELLPLSDRRVGESEAEAESTLPMAPDTLIEMIRSVVEPAGWESGDWSVEWFSCGELAVSAPTDVHAKIGELLATLERDLMPSERLELRLLPGGAGASTGATWVDRATSDKRIAATPPLHLARVALHDLLPRGTVSGTTRTYAAGFELQIAQGSFGLDPQVESWTEGLRVCARGTRIEGGALVDLLVSAATRAGDGEAVTPDAQGFLNMKPAFVPRSCAGRIELPRVGFASFGGTVLLNEGKVLWIPVSLGVATGGFDATLEVRCELGGSKPAATIEPVAMGDGAPLRLTLRRPPAGHLLPITGADPSEPDRIGALFNDRFFGESNEMTLGETADGEALLGLARRAAADEPDSIPWSHLAPQPDGVLRSLLSPAASDRVTKVLTTLGAPDLAATVRGRITVAGATRGEFSLPLLGSRRTFLWTGVQMPLIARWDTAVANDVAASAARIETVVDGAALRFELTRGPRGDLHLDVRGALQLLDSSPRLVDTGDAARHSLHHYSARTTVIHERVALPAKGGSVTLGGDVTLELTLVPQ